jgi:DNA-binding transcriptional ArsR family regulator
MNMKKRAPAADRAPRFAGMMAAMGAEPRLRIMRRLLSAHPDGLVAGDIGAALGIPGPTLSHHLEKLKQQDLVAVRREGTFLRYSANADALKHLLAFLYAECCSRSRAVEPESITRLCERC